MKYYHFLILVFILLLFNGKTFSQHRNNYLPYSKFEVKLGVGLEQGFNFGLNRYYLRNYNFGIGVGSHFPPKKQAHHFLLNTENNFHFVLTKRKVYEFSILLNQQIMFWRYSEPDFTHNAVTFGLNSGLRYASSNGFGFLLEVGPSITYTLKFEKVQTSNIKPTTNTIQPNFRLLLFQRF